MGVKQQMAAAVVPETGSQERSIVHRAFVEVKGRSIGPKIALPTWKASSIVRQNPCAPFPRQSAECWCEQKNA